MLLYKFRSFDGYSMEMLQRGALWVASPSQMNDPFDCKFDVIAGYHAELEDEFYAFLLLPHLSMIWRELHNKEDMFTGNYMGMKRKKVRELYYAINRAKSGRDKRNVLVRYLGTDGGDNLQTFETWKANVERDIDKIGFCSLCETVDNLLLWAHYAASHTGYALEFEIGPHHQSIDRLQQVRYTDDYPLMAFNELNLTSTIVLDEKGKAYSQRSLDFTGAWARKLVGVKSSHWAYEREWRYLTPEGRREVPYPFPLKAIYFGMRTPADKIKLAIAAIGSPEVKKYVMTPLNRQFGVGFAEYSE